MSENVGRNYAVGIEEIKNFLPHDFPFLLVDRALVIEPKGDINTIGGPDKVGSKAVTIKNVTFNEPFMPGHFPGFTIMPGVLIIEAMAQSTGLAIYPFCKAAGVKKENFKMILVGVNKARFKRQVIPGDTLVMEVVVAKNRGELWFFDCKAKVDNQLVASAEIMANLSSNATS